MVMRGIDERTMEDQGGFIRWDSRRCGEKERARGGCEGDWEKKGPSSEWGFLAQPVLSRTINVIDGVPYPQILFQRVSDKIMNTVAPCYPVRICHYSILTHVENKFAVSDPLLSRMTYGHFWVRL